MKKIKVNAKIKEIKKQFEIVKSVIGETEFKKIIKEYIDKLDEKEYFKLFEKYKINNECNNKDLIIIDGFLDEKINKNKIFLIKNFNIDKQN